MPSYEYMCVNCNTVREVEKALSEYVPGEMDECRECGGPMRRVFLSAPNVTYRGDGWTGAQRHGS